MSMSEVYDLSEMTAAELREHGNNIQKAATRVLDEDLGDDSYWQLTDELSRVEAAIAARSPKQKAAPAKKVYPNTTAGKIAELKDQLAEAKAANDALGNPKVPAAYSGSVTKDEKDAAVAKGRAASQVTDIEAEIARLERRVQFDGIDSDTIYDSTLESRTEIREARDRLRDAQALGDGEAMQRAQRDVDAAVARMRTLETERADRKHDAAIKGYVDGLALQRAKRARSEALESWRAESARLDDALRAAIAGTGPEIAVGDLLQAQQNFRDVEKIIRDDEPITKAELERAHKYVNESDNIVIRGNNAVEVKNW